MIRYHLYLWVSLFALFSIQLNAQGIQLSPIATGLNNPVDISHAGDDRLFVVERSGLIRIITTAGTVLSTPFLDIDDRVRNTSGQSEQGLLGLAFHPDYANNGYFYVHYTRNNGDSRIARFQVDANDPNLADPNSELTIMDIDQPFSNHNGGDLAFGPDSYLYIGLGDGGAGGDPGNRSQDPLNLLGKMLRIDIDQGNPYSIPPDNPFADEDATLDEIWALGLRNPWRFSFDRLTGDMWIGDVGQGAWEEIDFEPAGGEGGANYGWRCYEGNTPFNTAGCNTIGTYTAPLEVYSHGGFSHCSVTGGFVYRGERFPSLQGHYFYADYCSGTVWRLQPDGNGGWTNSEVGYFPTLGISSFGEDANGELYLASLSQNTVYRMDVEACFLFDINLSSTNETCAGALDGSIAVEVSTSASSYSINWSNGATGEELSGLGAGVYMLTVTDSDDCELIREVWLTNSSPDNVGIGSMGETTVCAGDSVVLVANEAPAGYIYEWYMDDEVIVGANEQQLIATATGWYYVKYIDGPCPSSNTSNWVRVVVNELPPNPFVELDGESTICMGDSVRLFTGLAPDGYTHRWMSGLDTIAQIEGDSSIYIYNSGTYYVIYDGLCPSAASNWATVNVNLRAPKPTLNPADELVLCDGESQPISALLAPLDYSYQWYLNGQAINGAAQQNLVVSDTGAYTLIYTGECPSPISDPVIVRTGTSPSLSLPLISPLCIGDLLDLSLLNPEDANGVLEDYAFFSDFPFEPSQMLNGLIEVNQSTNIYLLGWSATACRDTLAISIPTHPALDIPEILQNGTTLSVSMDYETYQWLLDGMPIPGANEASYVVTSNGTYSLMIGDEWGCTQISASIDMVITNTTALPTDFGLRLWPNPFQETLELAFTQAPNRTLRFQIWNTLGQLLWETSIPEQRNSSVQLSPSPLAPGQYLARVVDEEGQIYLLQSVQLMK
ncbi:MAG: PQQ-dependent sugar dehydrogenase [Bacteroidota bacterium]